MLKRLPVLLIVVLTLFAFTGKVQAIQPVRCDVTLYDNGELRQCVSMASTVAEFLAVEQITIYDKDDINVSLDDPIRQGMSIRIDRGFYVNVIMDGNLRKVKVGSKFAVGHMIAVLNNETGTDYYFDGPYNASLFPECEIILHSTKQEKYITNEALPYTVEVIETSKLASGVEEVVSYGSEGLKEIHELVTFDKSGETSREILDEIIIKEPVNHVIHRGVSNLLETREGNFTYVKEYTMSATAYHAGYESTGKRPGDRYYGITASGMTAAHGVVSVDPKVIPLGTRLYIENYGYSIAGDTGSGINGMKIDLYYETEAECRKFGRRNVKVYVLED